MAGAGTPGAPIERQCGSKNTEPEAVATGSWWLLTCEVAIGPGRYRFRFPILLAVLAPIAGDPQ
jgi:hypothetical protein